MDREALRTRYARWERCCAWIAARVDTTAVGLINGLCPFLPLPNYSVDVIRERSEELGPMIAAICEDAEKIGMTAEELTCCRPASAPGDVRCVRERVVRVVGDRAPCP